VLEALFILLEFQSPSRRFFIGSHSLPPSLVRRIGPSIFTQPDLNLRQRRWLELVKNYNVEIHYHPGKANVVADALSRKSYKPKNGHLQEEMARLNVQLSIQPTLESKIRESQSLDMDLMKIRTQTGEKKAQNFRVDDKGTLWYKDRICVPKEGDFRHTIMDEAHNSTYSIHLGATKMYMDLKQKCWWNGMKGDIAQFVAHCDTCQRIKAEHQKLVGLLQPLPILVWKWDEIGMDFVVGLPKTRKGNDSIGVIVDLLTKVAHYLPVRTNYGGEKLAQLYVDNIVKLHGVPSRMFRTEEPNLPLDFGEVCIKPWAPS
jgi:hypothetical protein